jgi:arginyl-tRNA synthetase
LTEAFATCGLPTETARATRSTLPDLADLECNGALAKSMKRNPRELAGEVAAKLEGRREFSEVSVAGPGFINLKLTDAFLSDCATTQAGDDHLGIVQVPGRIVLLDFGGPNVATACRPPACPRHRREPAAHLRGPVRQDHLRHPSRRLGLQMGMLISEIRRRWPPGTTPALTMADLQQLYPEAADADRLLGIDVPERMPAAFRDGLGALLATPPRPFNSTKIGFPRYKSSLTPRRERGRWVAMLHWPRHPGWYIQFEQ